MSGRQVCDGGSVGWDQRNGGGFGGEEKLRPEFKKGQRWAMEAENTQVLILVLLFFDGRHWRTHKHRCVSTVTYKESWLRLCMGSLSVCHTPAAVCWGAASRFWFLPVGKKPVWLFNRPQNGPHREICVYVHVCVCVCLLMCFYLCGDLFQSREMATLYVQMLVWHF